MEEQNNYCVYIHRNRINNKAYIGITKYGSNPNRRWQNGNGYMQKKDGKYTQPLFAYAIQKYGWDNFEHIVWVSGILETEAKFVEKVLIKLFDTNNETYGYNETLGGDGFDLNDVSVFKRTLASKEAKQLKRLKKSKELFEERFNNGDNRIIKCEKCGVYFVKEKPLPKKTLQKSMRKRNSIKYGSYKYCEYCRKYHKHNKKLVVCIDCGKEFIVKSCDTKTCRCEECQNKQ
jgi:hypothetical protein